MAKRAKPANGHPQSPKEEAAPAKPEAPTQVTFHYIKSNVFRVVHCDGVFGGPCPNGSGLNLAIFSERTPLPLQTTHELSDAGEIGKEVARVSRSGVVREVEVEVIISPPQAKSLIEWLQKHLKQLAEVKESVEDLKTEDGQ